MRSSTLVTGLALAAGIVVGSLGFSAGPAAPAAPAAKPRDPLVAEVRALSTQVAVLRDQLGRTPAPQAARPAAPAAPSPDPEPDERETQGQADARARAASVVDAAIASGRFTSTDRRELVIALASASPDTTAEVMSRLAVAVNSDRVILEPPGSHP
jgi:hypothetical protein